MDLETYLYILVIGILLFILLAFVAVADFIGFIGFLVRLSPKLKPVDYDRFERRVTSVPYKAHKRKWRFIYCSGALVYAVVFTLISVLLQNIRLGSYIGLLAGFINVGIIEKKEIKARKAIRILRTPITPKGNDQR